MRDSAEHPGVDIAARREAEGAYLMELTSQKLASRPLHWHRGHAPVDRVMITSDESENYRFVSQCIGTQLKGTHPKRRLTVTDTDQDLKVSLEFTSRGIYYDEKDIEKLARPVPQPYEVKRSETLKVVIVRLLESYERSEVMRPSPEYHQKLIDYSHE